MKVSFTIIAYNEEKNIANCINSILNQDGLKDYEIIVVNDGSKDKTSEIVKDFQNKNKKIKFIDFKENKGRGFARYTAVKNAKGDYIAFVDADCILPNNWLRVCLFYLKEYDAVGGIAVPDGDVAYIYKKFKLKPKVIPHTTETTGSNSIFKKSVLDKVKPNFNLKGGYDTDLNLRLKNSGFKAKSIHELVVKHEEDITFFRSIRRMVLFGKGATKLLFNSKKIRTADLAFFGFIFMILIGIIPIFFGNYYYLLVPILYSLLSSFLHLKSKFYFNKNFLITILFNYVFMLSYYYGRILGFFKK